MRTHSDTTNNKPRPQLRMCDVTKGSEVDVYVTHAESPSELYCQLAQAATQLPMFEDQLVDHCNSQESQEEVWVGFQREGVRARLCVE